MPISDEIIELAPVAKTKKKLIILFVIIGVLFALAVTFLVMYFAKPNVEENATVVRGVTITKSSLFTYGEPVSEGQTPQNKLYASVGNRYYVVARITVEKGASPDIRWDLDENNRDAITPVTPNAAELAAAGENESVYAFVVSAGSHGIEYTLKARSESNLSKTDTIKFNIVEQGAESIDVLGYKLLGSSASTPLSSVSKLPDGKFKVTLPWYITNPATNNKTYTMEFDQKGLFNTSTEEYLDVSTVQNANRVTVKSDNDSVVSIEASGPDYFSFRPKGRGDTKITITANENNPSQTKTVEILVEVKTNEQLGYVENIYFFDKPIVDGEFIKKITSGGTLLSKSNILTRAREEYGASESAEITIPYNNTYAGIYKHVLVDPVSLQFDYDEEADEWTERDGWYSKGSAGKVRMTESSGGKVIAVYDDNSGIRGVALASTVPNATNCTITFENRGNGIPVKREVKVNVVAENKSGALTLKDGSGKEVDATSTVGAAQQSTFTMSLAYALGMPGQIPTESVIQNEYMSEQFYLEFDPDAIEIKLTGYDEPLTATTDPASPVYIKYKPASMAIVRNDPNTTTTMHQLFTGTAVFTIKVKSTATDNETYTVKFHKRGTYAAGAPDGTDCGEANRDWSKTMTFLVQTRASSAWLMTLDEAKNDIPKFGEYVYDYVLSSNNRIADIYIKFQDGGTILSSSGGMFDIISLVRTDAAVFNIETDNWYTRDFKNKYFEKLSQYSNDIRFKTLAPSVQIDPNIVDVVYSITVDDTDGNLIKENGVTVTLTVRVHVVDPVESFDRIASPADVIYGKDTLSASKLSIGNLDIKVARARNNRVYSAYPSGDTGQEKYRLKFNLYVGGVATESTKLTMSDNGEYKFGSDSLFKYDSTNLVLTPLVDLFEYTYNQTSANYDFADLVLEFLVLDGDYCVPVGSADRPPIGTVNVKFRRNADGFALFTDSGYLDQSRLKDNDGEYKLTGTYEYPVNVNSTVKLYASSTVIINTETEHNKEIIVLQSSTNRISAVKPAFIKLEDNSFNPLGSTVEGSTDQYTDINYGVTATGTHVLSVYYGSSSKPITVHVQNLARPILGIKLYGDAEHNNELASGTGDDAFRFVFGGFINNTSLYNRTVYLAIEYDEPDENYMFLESVNITIPDYLTIPASGETGIFLKQNPPEGKKVYEVRPVCDKDKDAEEIPDIMLAISLNSGAADTISGNIFIEQSLQPNSGTRKYLEYNVRVGTGLAQINVTQQGAGVDDDTPPSSVYAGSTPTDIYYTFVLGSDTDAQTYTLLFDYVPIADNNLYPKLLYDNSARWFMVTPSTADDNDRKVFAITNNLKTLNDYVEEDGSISTVINSLVRFTIIPGEDLHTIGTYKLFSLEIKDTANGTDDNNTFLINIYLKVEIDIYALQYASSDPIMVTTTGENSGSQPVAIGVLYNPGAHSTVLQPTTSTIHTANVLSVVKKTGDSYVANDSGIYIDKSGANYTLKVPNSVVSGDYYVALSYGTLDPVYKKINIVTKSHHLELAEGNTITVPDEANDGLTISGSANIIAEAPGQTFTLAAAVVNDGTGLPVTGKTITYTAGKTAFGGTDSTDVTISSAGVVTVAPSAITGKAYIRAKYVDAGGTGSEYHIDILVTYKVKVTGASLTGIDANTYSGGALVLYYERDGAYTSVDLANHVLATNAFAGVSFATTDIAVTVEHADTASAEYFDVVDGTKIVPAKLSGASVVKAKITAAYGATSYSFECIVVIKAIDDLDIDSVGGTIDIAQNNSLTVVATYNNYDGFDSAYTLTSARDGLTISGGNTKTVSLASRTSSSFGTYVLTAKVSYTLTSGSTAVLTNGPFEREKTYTVTVGITYSPTFTLKADDVAIPAYTVANGAMHTVKEGDTYTVTIDAADHGDASATYVGAASPAVLTFGSFSSGVAAMTYTQNSSGRFTLTVTATVYDRTFNYSQDYFFTFGTEAEVMLEWSDDNGASYTAIAANATKAIDFTTTPYKFRYSIKKVDTSTVLPAAVNVSISGDIASADIGSLQRDVANRTYYIEFTVRRPTLLTVGSYIQVSSTRTVYLAPIAVTLTATPLAFDFNTNSAAIKPGDVETFSLRETTGTGCATTMEYSIVSGADYATINSSTGALTANADILVDRTVTVRATATVNNGVHAGNVYTKEKSITIYGIALPTLNVPVTTMEMTVGEVKSFAAAYSIARDVKYNSNSLTYSYNVTPVISITADGPNASDYSWASNTLTVNSTPRTLAGGKFTVNIEVTVNSAVHKNEVIRGAITVIVKPTLQTSNATISNGIATYDIKSAAVPYTTAVAGHFVGSTDTYEVEYELLHDAADSSVAFVSGSRITLLQNIIAARSIELVATVTITSGNYAGKVITATTAAVVALPTSTDKAVTWSAANKDYTAVSLTVGENADYPIQIGEVTSGSTTVTKITLQAGDAAVGFVAFTGNGGTSPSAKVDKQYNFEIGEAGSEKRLPVSYLVNTANGHVYYGTFDLVVPPVRVDITSKMDDDAFTEGAELAGNSGETFVVYFEANNGFTVSISNFTLSENNSSTNNMTVTFGSDRAILTASDVSSEKTIDATATLNVGGTTTTRSFSVKLTPAVTGSGIYVANNTDRTEIRVKRSGSEDPDSTIVSEWSSNQYSYLYPYSLTLSTADGTNNLSKYIKSATLKVVGGQNTSTSDFSVSGKSDIIYFPTQGSLYGGISQRRVVLYSFTLTIKMNTDSEYALSTINATLRAYNRDNGGSASSVVVQYRMRVIDKLTVTLDPNTEAEVTGITDTTIQVPYKGTYSLPRPDRTGYNFTGWMDANNSTVASGDTCNLTAPHTLYAGWSAQTYTVTLDANAGSDAVTVTPASLIATYDSVYADLPETLTRTGYTFNGWYYNNERIRNGGRVAITDSATFLAMWTARTTTVTFNAAGGSINTDLYSTSLTVTYGQPFGMLPVPTQIGKRFVCWYFSDDSEKAPVTMSTVVSITSPAVLVAEWSDTPYTVSLVLNGGSYSGSIAGSATVGGTYAIPADNDANLSRTGYSFAGWYTQLEGGSKIANGAAVPSDAEPYTTLYARWTADTYTVALEKYDGTINSGNVTGYTYGVGAVLPTNVTKTGHTFGGWYTGINGTGDKVETITATDIGDKTYHAKWTAATYAVTLVTNGGNVTGNVTSYTYGTAKALPAAVAVTKTGHAFKGWFDNEACTGMAIEQISATSTGDKVFYAKWQADTFTVTFVLSGGKVNGSTDAIVRENIDYGTAIATLVPDVEREGYRFAGWKNGGNTLAATDTVTATVTYTAQWQVNTYVVTLVKNGGTIGSGNVTGYTYGAGATLPTAVTRSGYEFKGWFANADFGGGAVTEISVTATGDKVFYAKWQVNSYVVTYVPGTNATVNPASKSVTFDAPYGELATPTKTGYTFRGWYLENTYATLVTAATLVSTANDHRLYAKWADSKDTVTVTFNANGGTFYGTTDAVKTVSVDYDTAIAAKLPTLTARDGYSYAWKAQNGDTVTATYAFTADQTVIAVWTANTYSITFALEGGNVGGSTSNIVVNDVAYGTAVATIVPAPEKTGYALSGWKNGGVTLTAATTVTGTVTYTAQWAANIYTVTLVVNGGAITAGSEVDSYTYGTAKALPTNVTKTGHAFMGWFDNESCTGSAVIGITATDIGNKVFFAKWQANDYVATYVPGAGAAVLTDTKNVMFGAPYGELITPTKAGYNFLGWYLESSFATPVTAATLVATANNHNLYAKWADSKNTITITFNANGGNFTQNGEEILSRNNVVYGEEIGELPTVNGRPGYTYEWKTAGGNTVTEDSRFTQDTELIVLWTKLSYIVTLDLEGGNIAGNNDNPMFTVGHGEFTGFVYVAPVKEGYTFVGWFADASGGSALTSIEVNDNITLHAQWEPNA